MDIVRSQSSLLAENRRLREQLALLRDKQAPISLDPDAGRVEVNNFRTPQYTVDRLTATSPEITSVSREMSDLNTWIKSNGALAAPLLSVDPKSQVTVQDFQLSVPYETLNEIIPKVAGPKLKEQGITDLKFSRGRQSNQISVKGKAKRLFTLGFEAQGELDVSKDGKPSFELSRAWIGGIPTPNFITTLATAVFAGSALEKAGVTQDGGKFTLDPKMMLPSNVEAPISGLSATQSGMLISGGTKDDSL